MKGFFQHRLPREKLLLLAFAGLVAVVWASATGGRAAAFAREYARVSNDLAEQRLWLERREAIAASAASAIANLDPARSFNAVRLSAELGAVAAATGLSGSTSSEALPLERTPQFAVNSVRYRITRSDWDTIKRFYLELSKRAPYITIEQFTLSAERANPAQLNALLKVTAVEVASGAAP
ncbi:hypothetical protein MASR2M8_03060 [Opitutaceae bacterium]